MKNIAFFFSDAIFAGAMPTMASSCLHFIPLWIIHITKMADLRLAADEYFIKTHLGDSQFLGIGKIFTHTHTNSSAFSCWKLKKNDNNHPEMTIYTCRLWSKQTSENWKMQKPVFPKVTNVSHIYDVCVYSSKTPR